MVHTNAVSQCQTGQKMFSLGFQFQYLQHIHVGLKIKIYIFQLGSRVLEEYEILKEVLYIDTIENKSCAHVKFAFRRRIEYHITNTFTQVKGKPYVQR